MTSHPRLWPNGSATASAPSRFLRVAAERGGGSRDVGVVRRSISASQIRSLAGRNDVDVKMHDNLAGRLATGIPEHDILGAEALLHPRGQPLRGSIGLDQIVWLDLEEIFVVAPGNDESVSWLPRIDVHERDRVGVLVHDGCGRLACGDGTEDAVRHWEEKAIA